jgi:hypothetical protein
MVKLNLLTYFSPKSWVNRRLKIIEYRTKKYDDLTDDELVLVITDLENAQASSKTFAPFINITAISVIGAAAIYSLKISSAYILTAIGVKVISEVGEKAIQFGRMVDVLLAFILIVFAGMFLFWFNDRKNMRTLMIKILKSRLQS